MIASAQVIQILNNDRAYNFQENQNYDQVTSSIAKAGTFASIDMSSMT